MEYYVSEKFNQAKGTLKKVHGKVTDDKNEKEGAAEKVVQKVKEVAGITKY